jgi:pimeloyl-ACP methyl ester carboxylesterase
MGSFTSGSLTVTDPDSGAEVNVRGADSLTDPAATWLRDIEAVHKSVVIAGVETSPDEGTRSIEVGLDPQTDAERHVVLAYQDGVYTWHAPLESGERLAGSHQTFRVPVLGNTAAGRGLGSSIIRVLKFVGLGRVLGEGAVRLVRKWEKGHHPQGFKAWNAASYRTKGTVPPDWDGLQKGRTLLLLHGTACPSHNEFGRFEREFVEKLLGRYEGRVIAFDHFTLSESPLENARDLVSQVPRTAELDVDILAVSRGGLVGRLLAEPSELWDSHEKNVQVNKMVFVATPNSGTALADPQHLDKFLSCYINLLTFLPDNLATEIFATLVELAKLLATSAVAALPGLEAMVPSGTFLNKLNRAEKSPPYYAIAADFEPSDNGLAVWARDVVVDPIFSGEPNDLIVPRDGTFSNNGSSGFPVENPLSIEGEQRVHHSQYFYYQPLLDQLDHWLRP